MKAIHTDPEFAAKMRAINSARMKALHANPEFAAKLRAVQSVHWSVEMDDALRNGIASGWSMARIARKVGVCRQTAINRADDLGIARRRYRRKPKTPDYRNTVPSGRTEGQAAARLLSDGAAVARGGGQDLSHPSPPDPACFLDGSRGTTTA